MAGPKTGNLQPANTCSVCLELVSDTSERSIAKLICGHQFHLDCIGSAFNAKGSMQCPNCRQIENGQWLYANGRLHPENSMSEDIMFEEEYDVEYDMFARVSELLFPEDLMIGHSQWCPYQGYTQLSLSLGNGDHHPIAHAEVVVNMLVGENLESSESVQPCPFVRAQALALNRRAPGVEENVRVQESSAHLRHGAPHRQRFTPSSRQWDRQSPAVFAPIGVVGGIGPQEGSQWPQLENQSSGHIPPLQSRHHSRRRRSSASTPSVTNIPASQFSPRPTSWDYSGTSTVQNAAREAEPRNNANFRQRRPEPTFWQYTSEAEGQRWAPRPLSGLYGTHGILDSELPTQVAVLDHHVQAASQAFHHLYPSAEDIDVQPSTSFYHPR